MYVLKNGKNFYIRIENGSVIKTPKFVEATKFRNTETAQTVIDLKPGNYILIECVMYTIRLFTQREEQESSILQEKEK